MASSLASSLMFSFKAQNYVDFTKSTTLGLGSSLMRGNGRRGGGSGVVASTTTTSNSTILSTLSQTKSLSLSLPQTLVTTSDDQLTGRLSLAASESGPGGMLVQNGMVYREHVLVRSFEIGPDKNITMAALMNHLQDTSLSHTSRMGIVAQGFGGTSYMTRHNLCWVITSTQVVVDRYPSWGEVFQIEHWLHESGKNGLGNDWLIRDGKTGEVLVRATNVCVLMNTTTRRLSKFVKQVRDEFAPHFFNHPQYDVVSPRDNLKIPRVDFDSADNILTSIQPGWCDLDINNHVSNIKYIDWIIGGAPRSILESRELCGMTLEYKKECRVDDGGLQSLSKIAGDDDVVKLEHLLCLGDGSEIMRARTIWRCKSNATTIAPLLDFPQYSHLSGTPSTWAGA
ncbi:Palmitoyl-acyl carrier protein thioesterase, chloroplastic [Linum perenne]